MTPGNPLAANAGLQSRGNISLAPRDNEYAYANFGSSSTCCNKIVIKNDRWRLNSAVFILNIFIVLESICTGILGKEEVNCGQVCETFIEQRYGL